MSPFRHSPLAVSYPSPMLVMNYPLVVTNVKNLCQKGSRKSSSLAGTIRVLRETYDTYGLPGLYKGCHLYLLHQAIRDMLRMAAESCIGLVERRLGWTPFLRPALQDSDETPEVQHRRNRFLSRLAVKYCIDGLCYPVLLASTRIVVLKSEESTWQRLCNWCQEEGLLSLFGGVAASLLSTALEEAMEMILAACIDRSAHSSNVDLADKLVLKACGGSVVSVFTAPINYVGVIQRCQSKLPGLPEPRPLWSTVKGLPWRGSFNQLLLFGGMLALNVRLVQWKLELQAEAEEDEE